MGYLSRHLTEAKLGEKYTCHSSYPVAFDSHSAIELVRDFELSVELRPKIAGTVGLPVSVNMAEELPVQIDVAVLIRDTGTGLKRGGTFMK